MSGAALRREPIEADGESLPPAAPAPALVPCPTCGTPVVELPAPRLTAAQMVRRLKSRWEFQFALSDLDQIPFGGELVLRTLAKMLAATESGTELPLHAPPLEYGSLTRAVAMKLRLSTSITAERQIAVLLEALARSKLIELSDTAMRFNLPPPKVQPHAHGYRAFANTPGTRPNGFTDDQWGDFKRAHREGYAAQRNGDMARAKAIRERMDAMRSSQRTMLLPIAGAAARPVAAPDTAPQMVGDFPPDFGNDFEIGGEIISDTGSDGYPPEPPRAVLPTTTQESIDSSVVVVSTSKPHASETAETISKSAAKSEGKSAAKSPPSPEAEQLAGDMVRRFTMPARAATTAPREVQGWLDTGATPELVRSVFDDVALRDVQAKGGKVSQRFPGYFTPLIVERVAEARPVPPAAASGAAPSQPAALEPIADDGLCPPELAEPWRRVRERLQREVGASDYRSWLRSMQMGPLADGELTIFCAGGYLATRVKQDYGDRLIAYWQAEGLEVDSVRVIRLGAE